MQRCPECNFVYEDDQPDCDMDGTLLIHDPCELPSNPRQVKNRRPSAWKRLPVLLTFVLFGAAVIFTPQPRQKLPFSGALRTNNQTATEFQTSPVSLVESQAERYFSTDSGRQQKRIESSGKGKVGWSRRKEQAYLAKRSSRPAVRQSNQAKNANAQSQAVARSDYRRTRKESRLGMNTDRKDSRIVAIFRKTSKILQRPFKL
jgi:hypothetical protein